MGGEYNRDMNPGKRTFSEGIDFENNLLFSEFSNEVNQFLSLFGFNMKEHRAQCDNDKEEDIYNFSASEDEIKEMFSGYLERQIEFFYDWDGKSTKELKEHYDYLKDTHKEIGKQMPEIDWTRLVGSEDIPEDVASFPVWAMDANEDCLSGTSVNEIMNLGEIRS